VKSAPVPFSSSFPSFRSIFSSIGNGQKIVQVIFAQALIVAIILQPLPLQPALNREY
jgi:hypothetical protein